MDGGKSAYDITTYETGIIKKGNEYIYIKTGKSVSQKDKERINKLKIPPSWINVHISSDPKTDIQATGIDMTGKKQYRYSDKHIKKAETEKFLRLYQFIRKIPDFNKTLVKHAHLNPYDKNHVISTMFKIVKELYLRMGQEKYAKKHKSYGISSLKKNHIKFPGDTITFRFKGKSHQHLYYSLKNPLIKNHLQQLMKLAGEKIFQYIDENGNIKKVSDMDLNYYIQHYMGSEFTTKDFRTYGANHQFIKSILDETIKRTPKNQKIIKKNLLNAIETTAHYLRHTKNISKKSYIMNFCVDYYIHNPDFFIARKYDDPNDVLNELLVMFIKKSK